MLRQLRKWARGKNLKLDLTGGGVNPWLTRFTTLCQRRSIPSPTARLGHDARQCSPSHREPQRGYGSSLQGLINRRLSPVGNPYVIFAGQLPIRKTSAELNNHVLYHCRSRSSEQKPGPAGGTPPALGLWMPTGRPAISLSRPRGGIPSTRLAPLSN